MKYLTHMLPQSLPSLILGATMIGAASLQAQVIYSDDFSGAGGLNGTAPDIRPGSETWSASAAFGADGVIDGNADGNSTAWLPFSPTTGNIYEFSIDMTTTASANINNWVGVTFASEGDPNGTLFNNGDYFGLASIKHDGTGYFRPGDGNTIQSDFTGLTSPPLNITITLDATDADSSNWTLNFAAVDQSNNMASSIASTAASGNFANIQFIGIGVNGTGSGSVDNFQLATIPEPATYSLFIGSLGLLFLVRRRR